jgi:hypothetical protein
MGALGVKSEEKWADQGVRNHGGAFYVAGQAKDLSQIGKKKCTRALQTREGPI